MNNNFVFVVRDSDIYPEKFLNKTGYWESIGFKVIDFGFVKQSIYFGTKDGTVIQTKQVDYIMDGPRYILEPIKPKRYIFYNA